MKFIDQEIENYCVEVSNQATEVLDELEQYTKDKVSMSQMLTGKLETSFLQFLIKSTGAKNILEIGTFTGYATLAMAYALPDDGKVITMDINDEVVAVAKEYWNKAKQDQKIESRIGRALEMIQDLDEKFDLVFIDADKENYFNYFELVQAKLSQNGIIVVDNALWSGKVLDPSDKTPATTAIVKLNQYLKDSKEFHSTLIPVRDGILLIKPNH